MVPYDMLGMVFILVCCSNCVPKKYRFWDIRLHLETRVRVTRVFCAPAERVPLGIGYGWTGSKN